MRMSFLESYSSLALTAFRVLRAEGGLSRHVDNLPARLLAVRLRPFRVEADDPQTGLHRVFAFHAKHPGIVLTKARTWGLTVTKIDELPPEA